MNVLTIRMKLKLKIMLAILSGVQKHTTTAIINEQ